MATDADIGFGVLFQTSVAGAWVTAAEVTSIKPPSVARDSIDASHELSPEAWREFIPGMKDGGEASFDFNFVPGGATYAALQLELDDSEVRSRRLVFPNGALYPFNAFLTGLEPDTPLDDKMGCSATFKVTGKPGPLAMPA